MTEQEAQEALLVRLRKLDHQYTEPSVLTPDNCPSPLRYPVVTTYDFYTDIQVFIVCVGDPKDGVGAFKWVNGLAKQIMVQWAPEGEEPLEFDCVLWVGMDPPLVPLALQWEDDSR
jgi:hypothetical protein